MARHLSGLFQQVRDQIKFITKFIHNDNKCAFRRSISPKCTFIISSLSKPTCSIHFKYLPYFEITTSTKRHDIAP